MAFLGRYCQTKRYQTQMHRRGCRPRSFAAVITNHSSHRQSHSINKGWIIGLDSSDFSTTGQLQLATRLWRFQCERLPVARNHSLHPKSGRTPRTRTFQQEYVAFLKRHELSFDDKYSLGLTMTSAVPPGRGVSLYRYPGTSYLATIMLSLRDKIYSSVRGFA